MSRLPREIETKRLILKVNRPEYFKPFREALEDALWDLKPWLDWSHPTPSLENTRQKLAKAQNTWASEEGLQMSIFAKETGKIIRCIALVNVDMRIPFGEIGYWCRSSEQGKGYMREAVCGLRDWMLDYGFKRIEIKTNTQNSGSRRVAINCGFVQEAVLKNASYSDYLNRTRDIVFYTYPITR